MHAIEELRRHALDSAPLTDERRAAIARRAAEQREPPLLAAMATLGDAALLEAWFVRVEDRDGTSWTDLELTCLARVETPEVDARIDELLDGARVAAMAEALARARQPWSHPALTSLLDESSARGAALYLLATGGDAGENDQLVSAIDELDSPREVASAFDALTPALDDLPELSEILRDWRRALDEADEDLARERDLLDALDAAASPGAWGRAYLRGDVERDWIETPTAVAAFMRHRARPSWLDTVAVLAASEPDSRAFGFAALLGVIASEAASQAGAFAREEVEHFEALAGLLTGATSDEELRASGARDHATYIEQRAVELGLHFALCMADEGLEVLCVEQAAHETLAALQLPSPGLSGLPLSATEEHLVDRDAAAELLLPEVEHEEIPDEQLVAVVRTLCDLRRWRGRDPAAFAQLAEAAALRWSEHDRQAAHLAARWLDASIDPQEVDALPPAFGAMVRADHDERARRALVERLEEADLVALAGLSRLARIGARATLATAWGEASWPHSSWIEEALLEALVEDGDSE